jgi:hypothetical protein
MVRRRTARGELSDEVSLRKCIRPLLGDILSPGHDDDAHVPVLINPSVTGNQLVS